jgi:hypothetical protein
MRDDLEDRAGNWPLLYAHCVYVVHPISHASGPNRGADGDVI